MSRQNKVEGVVDDVVRSVDCIAELHVIQTIANCVLTIADGF
jgi:hypothetical protein